MSVYEHFAKHRRYDQWPVQNDHRSIDQPGGGVKAAKIGSGGGASAYMAITLSRPMCAPIFMFLMYSFFRIDRRSLANQGGWGRKSGRGRRQGLVVRASEGEGSNPTIYKFFTHTF